MLLTFVLAADPKDAWVVQKPLSGSIFPKEMLSSVLWNEDGSLQLQNRGTVLSKKHFSKGATVRCNWKWVDGKEEGKFQDHFTVVFATDGRQRGWSHEVYDGLIVRFNAAGSSITVLRAKDGEDEPKVLGMVENIEMKRDVFYPLKVIDDGKKITVHFGEKPEPVLSVEAAERGEGDKIALYNREPVGGVVKTSIIKDLVVE